MIRCAQLFRCQVSLNYRADPPSASASMPPDPCRLPLTAPEIANCIRDPVTLGGEAHDRLAACCGGGRVVSVSKQITQSRYSHIRAKHLLFGKGPAHGENGARRWMIPDMEDLKRVPTNRRFWLVRVPSLQPTPDFLMRKLSGFQESKWQGRGTCTLVVGGFGGHMFARRDWSRVSVRRGLQIQVDGDKQIWDRTR